MRNKLAPIVLFVFNRPDHTKKTLQALSENSLSNKSDLFIFCDGARNPTDLSNVNKVVDIIKDQCWLEHFNTVNLRISNKNKGLGSSVVDGVSDIINKYGTVIVLEDDIVTHKQFLVYMNKMLNTYEEDNSIFSISGYMPKVPFTVSKENVCFVPRVTSWGWATWKSRWDKVDWEIRFFDDLIFSKTELKAFGRTGKDKIDMLVNQVKGKNTAWAVKFEANRHYAGDMLTVYPQFSLVDNIGNDGSGTHNGRESSFCVDLENRENPFDNFCYVLPSENKDINEHFCKVYKRNFKSFVLANYHLVKYRFW